VPSFKIHGHLKAEIFEDVATGEGAWTGLGVFPAIVGLADGPPPEDAVGTQRRNWAGNVEWSSKVVAPTTREEVAAVVRGAEGRVRALGRGHSFTPACDSEGTILSVAKLNAVLEFDTATGLLTVQAGITYTALFQFLAKTDWALDNVASLPHVTVGGAFSTGTHGSSGVDADGRAMLGNLGSQATALSFVVADGSTVTYEQGVHPEFDAVRVGIGCLGVVTEVTLQLVPTYNVAQACYKDMGVTELIDNFDEMLRSCDSFSALIDFPNGNVFHFVTRKRVAPGIVDVPDYPETLWGGTLSEDGFSIKNLEHSTTGTHTAPWHEVLFYHVAGGEEGKASDFWADYTELQLEYFVDLADSGAALRAAHACSRRWTDASDTDKLFGACELRVVRADSEQSLLSPVRGRDSLVLHFSISTGFGQPCAAGPNGVVGQRALDCCAEMEAALGPSAPPPHRLAREREPEREHDHTAARRAAPFAPRPHWGKLFTLGAADIAGLYGPEAIRAFRALAAEHDPSGKFRNDWIDALLF
jgi:xylitol oxidase